MWPPPQGSLRELHARTSAHSIAGTPLTTLQACPACPRRRTWQTCVMGGT